MPRRTKVDEMRAREALRNDPELVETAKVIGRLADREAGDSASFLERSQAARRVAEMLLSDLLAEENNDADEREDPGD